MEVFFVEPNTVKSVFYFATFYFHFHQNQTVTETGMNKKKQALGNLPEKNAEKRRRRKKGAGVWLGMKGRKGGERRESTSLFSP